VHLGLEVFEVVLVEGVGVLGFFARLVGVAGVMVFFLRLVELVLGVLVLEFAVLESAIFFLLFK